MTNKINGIDVSECRHHYTNPVNGVIYHACAIYEQKNELGYWQDTLCEQNPNCYFKQLKRLQEENEKLKEKIKSEKYIKENALQEATKYSMKCGEFRQALEEIREISKQCMTKDLCSIDCDYADRCYIEDEEVPTYDICKLIIEKIDEALNGRD